MNIDRETILSALDGAPTPYEFLDALLWSATQAGDHMLAHRLRSVQASDGWEEFAWVDVDELRGELDGAEAEVSELRGAIHAAKDGVRHEYIDRLAIKLCDAGYIDLAAELVTKDAA